MPSAQNNHLPYRELKQKLDDNPLFQGKTWKISPEAFPLDELTLQKIHHLGQACYEFYHALNRLYIKSSKNENIIRNQNLKTPWVANYLERGKPERLIKYGKSTRFKNSIPPTIRPDILITENGLALTELDSVPGGIGLTAFLYELYKNEHEAGGCNNIINNFHHSIANLTPQKDNPVIACVVSDEAETYRPEYKWLEKKLQYLGKKLFCIHPNDISEENNELLFTKNKQKYKIDIIYRFFELFDLDNIPSADLIMKHAETGTVVVTPPIKTYQEEKLNLALYKHYQLKDYWSQNLSKTSKKILDEFIPNSWIIDPSPIGPNATLWAPKCHDREINAWAQLGDMSQKERHYIIKISGFHETAWGARSVTLGSDSSQKEWQEALNNALNQSNKDLYIIQEYQKPKLISHKAYNQSGKTKIEKGRVRLCPYYHVTGEGVTLGGVLATICPADKKIIHGMEDAVMAPSRKKA